MSEPLFRKKCETYGKKCFVHKLTDTGMLTGANKKLVHAEAQPADFVVTLHGITFYAEVKESANKTSFPFGNIRPTQLAFAKQIIASGGHYYFFILRKLTGQWFQVPAQVILATKDKKSLTWTELELYPCTI